MGMWLRHVQTFEALQKIILQFIHHHEIKLFSGLYFFLIIDFLTQVLWLVDFTAVQALFCVTKSVSPKREKPHLLIKMRVSVSSLHSESSYITLKIRDLARKPVETCWNVRILFFHFHLTESEPVDWIWTGIHCFPQHQRAWNVPVLHIHVLRNCGILPTIHQRDSYIKRPLKDGKGAGRLRMGVETMWGNGC